MNTEQLKTLATASLVPVLIGFAAWKFGKGNLVKAMGAGVLGVQAATVIRSVTGL